MESMGNDKAKVYQRIKQKLSLIHLAITPSILFLAFGTPLSIYFRELAYSICSNAYGMVVIYFVLFSLFMLIFDLPFSIYSGFILEQRFELSNQNFTGWFVEFLKKSILSLLFSALLILGLYTFIWKFPERWWLIAWACFAFVSYLMGKIFPVFIVPLFYKYSKVDDVRIKDKIVAMAKRFGMPIENVYSLNLSKTTKKANAAFMGIGKTKRVVLSDTLIEKFTPDEIEVVVAHELGHFKHKDIWRQLILGLVTSLISFWIAFQVLGPLATRFGYEGAGDVAALPLLFMVFYFFSLGLMPLQNGFSRMLERAADRFALEVYPQPQTFISCMEKLATVNLADPTPNPIYEWFFYDHPAIAKRVQMARTWKAS